MWTYTYMIVLLTWFLRVDHHKNKGTPQPSNYIWYNQILHEHWQSLLKWIFLGTCAETKRSLLPKQSKRPGHCACCLAPSGVIMMLTFPLTRWTHASRCPFPWDTFSQRQAKCHPKYSSPVLFPWNLQLLKCTPLTMIMYAWNQC